MTRRRKAEQELPARASVLSERVVLVFLVAAAIALSYIYFHVVPSRYTPPQEPFDLVNPMLDAEIGECVTIESTTMPQTLICARVREPGVVLRPREGPNQLGSYRGLRRSRPYLVCGLRYPPPRRDCSEASEGREDYELFDLNAFGMPYGVSVSLQTIRPAWVQLGGRNVFVYEVQLRQYGRASGRTWYIDVHLDAPVTGIVRRRHGTERGEVHWHIFTKASGCS